MRAPVELAASLERRTLAPALSFALGLGAALLLAAIAILANAALLSVAVCAAPTPERYTLTGTRLELCDLAGTVRLVAGSGPRAEVVVTRGGRDADRLRVETREVNGRSELRVLYPGNRVVYPRLGAFSRSTLSVTGEGCLAHAQKLAFTTHRVTVQGGGQGLEAWADLEVRVPPGREVTLHLGVGEAAAEGVEGKLHLDLASAPARAERTRGPLSVDTGSGDVTLRDCQGEFVLNTGSGRVSLEDVRGGSLSVDTGSGAVEGERLATDGLAVDTGSGRIALQGVRSPEIRLETGSGGVRLGLERGPNTLTVETGSGSVAIVGPPELNAAVRLETSVGSIDTDYELRTAHRDTGTLEGTIGDGRGQIRVETGSGSVSLKQR